MSNPEIEALPDWKATAGQDLDYHRRQFQESYRSTVHLGRFMRSLLVDPRGDALDVGCGAGANMYHLSREFPDYQWTGVDIAGEVLFPIGKERFADRGTDVQLIEGDFFNLRQILPARRFDLVLSIQTLHVLPHYEAALEQLLEVSRGWLFITGLFSEFDVDALVVVNNYTWPGHVRDVYHYNVYSQSRVRAFCEARGARDFFVQDFDIDIDLPMPQDMGMGTYTEMLANGRRLQFTGPLLQPWKFLAIRMGGK
jgi:SAM-dependent methyltransferase